MTATASNKGSMAIARSPSPGIARQTDTSKNNRFSLQFDN